MNSVVRLQIQSLYVCSMHERTIQAYLLYETTYMYEFCYCSKFTEWDTTLILLFYEIHVQAVWKCHINVLSHKLLTLSQTEVVVRPWSRRRWHQQRGHETLHTSVRPLYPFGSWIHLQAHLLEQSALEGGVSRVRRTQKMGNLDSTKGGWFRTRVFIDYLCFL